MESRRVRTFRSLDPARGSRAARRARHPGLSRIALLVVVLASRVLAQDPGGPAGESAAVSSGATTVAILLYDGVELLDFAGPGEVFSSLPRTRVVTVSERPGALSSMGFVEIVPEFTPVTCPAPEIIVVPGGGVPTPGPELVAWLHACVERGGVVMSVCNGALVLARAGLLAGLEATTHHSAFESLALVDPTITVLRNRRYVDHGSVVTTAGISAGIDGALAVTRRLFGEQAARDAVAYMEYDWRPDEIAREDARPGDAVDLGLAGELLLALRDADVGAVFDDFDARLAALDDDSRRETERLLNLGGYALLLGDRVVEARDVFEFQVRAFPASANPLDSLAECCERLGETGRALDLARRTLLALPGDTALQPVRAGRIRDAARARIARLEGRGSEARAWRCPPCGAACDGLSFVASGACPDCGMPLARDEG
ncbi:MAG: DJ-1/PfpI family protein [Planctomycetes bacterium]|nr:DJ-1/PfpI family protein [Planctomycetota bacterium]